MSRVYWTIPAATRRSSCRSCGAEVYWISTDRGAKMPVSVDPTRAPFGESRHPSETEPGLGFSHFVTCPNAAAHRRGRIQ